MADEPDMPTAEQVAAVESGEATHSVEPHTAGMAGRLNW